MASTWQGMVWGMLQSRGRTMNNGSKRKPTDIIRLSNEKPVLVVDDERFSRSIIMNHLREIGFQGTEAVADVTTALQALITAPNGFCAAICDFSMPLLTGLHFAWAVRTGFQGIPNHLPVMMLTGYSDSALVGGALRLDVDAFVVKPVSRATLEGRLRHALAGGQPVGLPASYAGIDIDALVKAVQTPPRKREGLPAASAPSPPPGRAMPVTDLAEGAVLAEDLCAPSGELILASGFRLSGRMINRIRELSILGVVPHVIHVV